MNFIPLAKPNISNKAKEKVIEILNSGLLVQGKQVEIFEKRIAEYLAVKHAICVSSGTATLHLSLIALGIGRGDEVIVPAFSYIATANVVELVGAKPIFIDIDHRTFNIDITKIEEKISRKTKAIIPVHEFGLAADITKIVDIAKKHNLYVIEDAACALGAKENDQFVGTFGQLGSFSLHPRKAITSGEGGIVTTNDNHLAREIKILRNHGIEILNGKMDFVRAGFNYRMTDIQAALVDAQFDGFELLLNRKQELAEIYLNEINNNQILLPFVPNHKTHTWQTFHILLRSEVKRDALKSFLSEHDIMTNYGAQCIPHMKYYKNKYKYNSEVEFPNAYLAYNCGLAIPLFNQLTIEEIKYISETINKFN